MIAVIWTPSESDPTSGTINMSMRATEETIAMTAEAMGANYLEIPVFKRGYDATHHIVSGQMVPL